MTTSNETKAREQIRLASQYSARFGHSVPMASLQRVSDEEIDRLIKEALESGTPVKGWSEMRAFSVEPKNLNPDSGPDSEIRGWKQHLGPQGVKLKP